MQARTGCDGVMIGRAAMANPWIFDGRDGASLAERIDLAVELLNLMARYKGERVGVLESRKHLALYFRGLGRDSAMRRKILTTRSLGELVDILQEWRDDLEDDLPETDLTLSRDEAGALAWGSTG
jgi:tRNA-dihydrouridine synthase